MICISFALEFAACVFISFGLEAAPKLLCHWINGILQETHSASIKYKCQYKEPQLSIIHYRVAGQQQSRIGSKAA
jgi:hypothetical protein